MQESDRLVISRDEDRGGNVLSSWRAHRRASQAVSEASGRADGFGIRSGFFRSLRGPQFVFPFADHRGGQCIAQDIRRRAKHIAEMVNR